VTFASTDDLVGREQELRIVADLVAGLPEGNGGCVLVRGGIGAGKTALLEAAVRAASGAGVRSIRVRGTLAEASEPGAGLRQLSDGLASASGSQPRTEPRSELVQAILREASKQPVLIVVDDAAGLDGLSWEALVYLAQRLERTMVGLVMASPPDGAAGSLEAQTLQLQGLAGGHVCDLLQRHVRHFSNAVAAEISQRLSGNPLALLQIVRHLDPEQVAGSAPLPDAMPLPARVLERLSGPLRALPPATRDALLVTSFAAGITELERALRHMGSSMDALTPAEERGVVRVESFGVAFVEPLLAEGIRSLAPFASRRAAHAAMAAVVESDPARRGWHMARATLGTDGAAADQLVAAARHAAATGRPAAAADLLEQGARLAAERERAEEIRGDAAGLWLASGAASRVHRLVQLSKDDAAVSTVRPTVFLAHQRLTAVERSPRAAHRAFRQLRDGDEVRPELILEAVGAAIIAGDAHGAIAASAHLASVPRSDEPTAAVVDVAMWASEVMCTDNDAEPPRLEPDGLDAYPLLRWATILVLVRSERFDAARALVTEASRCSRARGWQGLLPNLLALQALVELRVGRVREAAALASEAAAGAARFGQGVVEKAALAVASVSHAVVGQDDECRTAAGRLLAAAGDGGGLARCQAMSAIALLELGSGRFEEAARWYGALAKTAAERQVPAGGVGMWELDYAEALLAVGRPDEARDLVDALDEASPRVGRRHRAAVARVRGSLATEDDEAEAFFRRAALLCGNTFPFGQGRLELTRAERAAREGDPALAAHGARMAMRRFAGVGAGAWVARSARLLEDLGWRSARTEPSAAPEPELVEDVLKSAASAAQTVEPPAAPFRVTLMGTFRVENGAVDSTPAPGHGSQIVKLVAVRGPMPVDEVVEALWPEAGPSVGRTRLRNVLARTRDATGGLLVRDGDVLRLASATHIDVAAFEESARKALAAAACDDRGTIQGLQTAAGLYDGELLPGDRFTGWTALPRQRLATLHLEILDTLAAKLAERGELLEAVRRLEQAAAEDRYDESRYVRTAELLAKAGLRSRALGMLRRARDIAGELGLPPSVSVEQFECQLRSS
jgi:DNA-binding SARP family transcriptional activator